MQSSSGATQSIWAATVKIPSRPPLQESESANVCVVGAGIAGMTTAHLLARAGKSVVVLDDGPIGGGMTGRTTAHLVTALDDRYFELERLHGKKGAWLAAESHAAAIDQVERIVLCPSETQNSIEPDKGGNAHVCGAMDPDATTVVAIHRIKER